MRRRWLALAVGLALVLTSGGTAAATGTTGTGKAVTAAERLLAGYGPPGFWWGTDSLPVAVPGGAPYSMPFLGGAYGGYIGMTGTGRTGWAAKGTRRLVRDQQRPGETPTTSPTTGASATGVYWFMGGPGVDPALQRQGNGRGIRSGGEQQAARTLYHIFTRARLRIRRAFMDVEIPGNAPNLHPRPPTTAWSSGLHIRVQRQGEAVPHPRHRSKLGRLQRVGGLHHGALARTRLASTPPRASGRRSSGPGTASLIPNSYEWTYEPETSSLSPNAPFGRLPQSRWRDRAVLRRADSAPSAHVLMWQWSGGGGVRKKKIGFSGDFDQIDSARQG